MNDIKDLTIDWNRSLLIDTSIDDDLVRRLTPKILALRQESTAPITIGINSPGGSLASLDVLLGLLTGPNQDGQQGEIITVATHRAYSAAASFLAFGTYAVALPHAQVLYHDVRFGGIEDVTPGKARDAAKSLQEANDAFALRLSHRVIQRLIWIYIDVRNDFPKMQSLYPKPYKAYTSLVAGYAPKVEGCNSIDLVSFALSLWSNLSTRNDTLIPKVMDRLARWIKLTETAKTSPTYRTKGSKTPGLLDGASNLYNKHFSGKTEHFQSSEESLKLLLSLLIADISSTKSDIINFSAVLERSVSEFAILNSMNDPKHIRYAANLMLQHSHIFFDKALTGELDLKPEPEKTELFTKAAPNARLLWHFCILLCRELFEGEHILEPSDAQLLGLIDEVSGGGPIQSRRDFRIDQARKTSSTAPEQIDK